MESASSWFCRKMARFEGAVIFGFGDVVYGSERSARSARYFVFVLDRQVKGCIISFVVWRSAVCFFGKPLIARV